MFTIAGSLTTVANYGADYAKYEENVNQIIRSLHQLRQQHPIDYPKENDLIETLKAVENNKNRDSKVAAIDLSNKSIKVCVGPLGEIACDAAASAMRHNAQGHQLNVKTIAEEVVDKHVKKQIITTTMNSASQLLDAGALALMITNAPIIAGAGLATGTIALASSSKLRQSCWNGLKNTLKGTAALVKEGSSKILGSKNTTTRILDSYDNFKSKQIEVVHIKHQKKAQIAEKERLISSIDTCHQEIEGEKNRFADLQARILGEIEGEKNEFKTLRTKSQFARFVYRLNQRRGFFRFLTIIFCWISKRFRAQKKMQDSFRFRISAKMNSIPIEQARSNKIIEDKTKSIRISETNRNRVDVNIGSLSDRIFYKKRERDLQEKQYVAVLLQTQL